MTLAGVSLVLILGIVNFVLLAFQLSTGLRWIRVPPGVHRRTGMILAASGTVHGGLALLAELL
jgi:hypothetical protein